MNASRSTRLTPPPLAQRLRSLEAAFLRTYRRQVAVALVAMFCQSLLLLPLPWLQGRVIDRLIPGKEQAAFRGAAELLTTALLIPLACLVGRAALGWYSSTLMSRISLEFVRALTDALHRKLQRLPMSFYDRHQTGQLMARLTNDVGTLLIFLGASSLQLVADLVLALGIIAVLLLLSWPLALVSFLALPLLFWNYRGLAKRLWKLSQDVQRETSNLYAQLSERISAVRTIRAFGTENQELTAFSEQLDRQTTHAKDSLQAASLQSFLAVLIAGLSTTALVVLAAIFIQRGVLSTGQALAFIAYLALLYQPVVRLTQFYGGMTATLAAVERITEVLDEPEPASRVRRRWQKRTPGLLELRNVSFRYRSERPLVLDRINLQIKPATTVGLCGPSGCGKSTLLSLLPRLYEVPSGSGRILLDGRDIRSLHTGDLRRAVMLVAQQARLFEGTLRFNLTYAAPRADETQIYKVLECVDLADLVRTLPQGLETWVGERGASLSGGQRQRLALARALLARPPLLLLDDCTSALDAQTEERVRRRLGDFHPYQTRVVVSHRPEALLACDWLVMLEGGRIVRQGEPWQVITQDSLAHSSG